jgi:hypothetical protein
VERPLQVFDAQPDLNKKASMANSASRISMRIDNPDSDFSRTITMGGVV